MEEVTNISYEAINRYFSTLSYFGYKSYKEVDKLLVLFFINDLLLGEFSQFVTEEDYRSITNALYCLSGNPCTIPYIEFLNNPMPENKLVGSFVPLSYQSDEYEKLKINSFQLL